MARFQIGMTLEQEGVKRARDADMSSVVPVA
eukprot:SAG11_NODE_36571_length_261_cov_0.314815_1_plen_30_part_01